MGYGMFELTLIKVFVRLDTESPAAVLDGLDTKRSGVGVGAERLQANLCVRFAGEFLQQSIERMDITRATDDVLDFVGTGNGLGLDNFAAGHIEFGGDAKPSRCWR